MSAHVGKSKRSASSTNLRAWLQLLSMDDAMTVRAKALKVFEAALSRFLHVRKSDSMVVHLNAGIAQRPKIARWIEPTPLAKKVPLDSDKLAFLRFRKPGSSFTLKVLDSPGRAFSPSSLFIRCVQNV